MGAWFLANYVNILLILAVAGLVTLLIRSLIRDKKTGKCSSCGSCSACGGACAGCACAARCRAAKGGKKEGKRRRELERRGIP